MQDHDPVLVPLDLARWIDRNRALLKPPVGNRELFKQGEFIIMVVGGPNSRKDFHVDPGDEFFMQIEGQMTLRVVENGKMRDIALRAGELLLLPGGIAHSPQRPADTVGLVIERQRRKGELDGFQWYCERCNHLLHEEFLQLTDIETQLAPVFARFYADPALRRCRHCGHSMERPD
ncbi:MAG: 3-hydroxyanthranilate 3,4-dioxygenase [Steroidobacteraceae bacterium]